MKSHDAFRWFRGFDNSMRTALRPRFDHDRRRRAPCAGGRRLLLIQLDGVSRRRLEAAVRKGYAPFLGRLLDGGRFRISGCRSGAPASTPAFQAGLLYGVSPSVPGYLWWDRASGREFRMDSPVAVAAVEAGLATHNPGLLEGGTTYPAIFGGGARHCSIGGLGRDPSVIRYAPPRNGHGPVATEVRRSAALTCLVGRMLGRLARGVVDGAMWSARCGRLLHEPTFLLNRVLCSCVFYEAATSGVIADIALGTPKIYCDFLAYDETAHRRGPGAGSSLLELRAADRAIARIFAALASNPELGYDVFIFSDHGNVEVTPFESLVGLSLSELLARAAEGAPLGAGDGPRVRSSRVVTVEAGDYAHVYIRGRPAPLDREELRRDHQPLLDAVAGCDAIGVAGVRGGRRGYALVRGRTVDLADDGEVATLPHPEPRLLATYLSDLLSLAASGDLVLLGWRGPDLESVAFAWEFGSHGSVAPEETNTFFIHPADCDFRFERVVRPDELYRWFSRGYASPAPCAPSDRR